MPKYKVVTNTVVTNSKPTNTDKDKIMKLNVCKANYSLCRDNEVEGGKNIHFAIDNKMPDGKKNTRKRRRTRKRTKGRG